ncbi:hypothetical protein MPSI1_003963 [Malassezia psittaci]|uniref:Uncharacterized protein n=1 Tax=Malassezia psittaci TaxID=1821823 RepID=A0AAF0FFX8_9BASI|nr:hypothetical protein MPSI1_003963 [Malassezia psittaci]
MVYALPRKLRTSEGHDLSHDPEKVSPTSKVERAQELQSVLEASFRGTRPTHDTPPSAASVDGTPRRRRVPHAFANDVPPVNSTPLTPRRALRPYREFPAANWSASQTGSVEKVRRPLSTREPLRSVHPMSILEEDQFASMAPASSSSSAIPNAQKSIQSKPMQGVATKAQNSFMPQRKPAVDVAQIDSSHLLQQPLSPASSTDDPLLIHDSLMSNITLHAAQGDSDLVAMVRQFEHEDLAQLPSPSTHAPRSASQRRAESHTPTPFTPPIHARPLNRTSLSTQQTTPDAHRLQATPTPARYDRSLGLRERIALLKSPSKASAATTPTSSHAISSQLPSINTVQHSVPIASSSEQGTQQVANSAKGADQSDSLRSVNQREDQATDSRPLTPDSNALAQDTTNSAPSAHLSPRRPSPRPASPRPASSRPASSKPASSKPLSSRRPSSRHPSRSSPPSESENEQSQDQQQTPARSSQSARTRQSLSSVGLLPWGAGSPTREVTPRSSSKKKGSKRSQSRIDKQADDRDHSQKDRASLSDSKSTRSRTSTTDQQGHERALRDALAAKVGRENSGLGGYDRDHRDHSQNYEQYSGQATQAQRSEIDGADLNGKIETNADHQRVSYEHDVNDVHDANDTNDANDESILPDTDHLRLSNEHDEYDERDVNRQLPADPEADHRLSTNHDVDRHLSPDYDFHHRLSADPDTDHDALNEHDTFPRLSDELNRAHIEHHKEDRDGDAAHPKLSEPRKPSDLEQPQEHAEPSNDYPNHKENRKDSAKQAFHKPYPKDSFEDAFVFERVTSQPSTRAKQSVSAEFSPIEEPTSPAPEFRFERFWSENQSFPISQRSQRSDRDTQGGHGIGFNRFRRERNYNPRALQAAERKEVYDGQDDDQDDDQHVDQDGGQDMDGQDVDLQEDQKEDDQDVGMQEEDDDPNASDQDFAMEEEKYEDQRGDELDFAIQEEQENDQEVDIQEREDMADRSKSPINHDQRIHHQDVFLDHRVTIQDDVDDEGPDADDEGLIGDDEEALADDEGLHVDDEGLVVDDEEALADEFDANELGNDEHDYDELGVDEENPMVDEFKVDASDADDENRDVDEHDMDDEGLIVDELDVDKLDSVNHHDANNAIRANSTDAPDAISASDHHQSRILSKSRATPDEWDLDDDQLEQLERDLSAVEEAHRSVVSPSRSTTSSTHDVWDRQETRSLAMEFSAHRTEDRSIDWQDQSQLDDFHWVQEADRLRSKIHTPYRKDTKKILPSSEPRRTTSVSPVKVQPARLSPQHLPLKTNWSPSGLNSAHSSTFSRPETRSSLALAPQSHRIKSIQSTPTHSQSESENLRPHKSEQFPSISPLNDSQHNAVPSTASYGQDQTRKPTNAVSARGSDRHTTRLPIPMSRVRTAYVKDAEEETRETIMIGDEDVSADASTVVMQDESNSRNADSQQAMHDVAYVDNEPTLISIATSPSKRRRIDPESVRDSSTIPSWLVPKVSALPAQRLPSQARQSSPAEQLSTAREPSLVKQPFPVKSLSSTKQPSPEKSSSPVKSLSSTKQPSPVKSFSSTKQPSPVKSSSPSKQLSQAQRSIREPKRQMLFNHSSPSKRHSSSSSENISQEPSEPLLPERRSPSKNVTQEPSERSSSRFNVQEPDGRNIHQAPPIHTHHDHHLRDPSRGSTSELQSRISARPRSTHDTPMENMANSNSSSSPSKASLQTTPRLPSSLAQDIHSFSAPAHSPEDWELTPPPALSSPAVASLEPSQDSLADLSASLSASSYARARMLARSRPTACVEIASLDPHAAARAAAILRVHHQYIQEGWLRQQASDSLDMDDQRLDSSSGNTHLPALLTAAEYGERNDLKIVPPSTPYLPGAFPPRSARKISAPRLSAHALRPQACAGKWSEYAWSELDRHLQMELYRAMEQNPHQTYREVILDLDVDRILGQFLDAEGLELDDLQGEWTLSRLHARIPALQLRLLRKWDQLAGVDSDEQTSVLLRRKSFSALAMEDGLIRGDAPMFARDPDMEKANCSEPTVNAMDITQDMPASPRAGAPARSETSFVSQILSKVWPRKSTVTENAPSADHSETLHDRISTESSHQTDSSNVTQQDKSHTSTQVPARQWPSRNGTSSVQSTAFSALGAQGQQQATITAQRFAQGRAKDWQSPRERRRNLRTDHDVGKRAPSAAYVAARNRFLERPSS